MRKLEAVVRLVGRMMVRHQAYMEALPRLMSSSGFVRPEGVRKWLGHVRLEARAPLVKLIEAAETSIELADAVMYGCSGYAEPGYADPESGIVALGDWNGVGIWLDGAKAAGADLLLPRIARALEKRGIALEWEDEWKICDTCGRLVRATGNCYGWTRAYLESEETDEIACFKCLQADEALARAWLEEYEGAARRSVSGSDFDLTKYGYRRVDVDFKHGLYGGQKADPKLVAAALQKRNCGRFLFSVDSVGQFDCAFSVYVHESEWPLVEGWRPGVETDGVDPAEVCKRALQSIPTTMANREPGKIVVNTIRADGTVETKQLTPKEFIEKGIG